MKVRIEREHPTDEHLAELFYNGMITLQYNPASDEIEYGMTAACDRLVEKMGVKAV